MTNRDPDVRYTQLEQALAFCFRQESKNIHTAIPGVVEMYDATTKRADVQIAINQLIGRIDKHESHPRPILLNVPVIWPSGGGYVVHMPLVRSDAVMLLFNERGIEKFKETYRVSDPTIEALFEERDAVAIAGFGDMTITPAGDGLVSQTEDGEQYIHINANGEITVNATETITAQVGSNNVVISSDGSININASASVTINAPRITLAGSSDTLIVP